MRNATATRLTVIFALLAASGAPLCAVPLAKAEVDANASYAPALVAADFAHLYATLRASHYDLYARAPRPAYDRLFTQMRNEIRRPMMRAEVVALFQRFMAFGRIAHARIDAAGERFTAYRASGGAIFPLATRVIDGHMFVAGNDSGVASVRAGDEIVALDGQPVSHWLTAAAQHISADTPYMLGAMLEWDLPRIIWAERGPAASFALRLRRPGGADRDVTIPARTTAAIKAERMKQPPRLELSWEKREARMLDGSIAYLRPGPTYNVEGDEAHMYDNSAFRAFIDRSFERFLAAGATDLVIDLRDNSGGDNSFSDIMVAWFATKPFRFNDRFNIKVSPATIASNADRLAIAGNDPTGVSAQMAAAYAGIPTGRIIPFPIDRTSPRAGQHFSGRVYALINRQSYSNTVAIAATIQDNGFGTILGEETSDLATTYGAMERFTLPRTQIVVGYPKALIVRPSGLMRARGVVPDIFIATPVIEGPDDPVLRRALAIVGDRQHARR